MAAKSNEFKDGASPGKIFVGGLPKDTTTATFTKHFGNYGKIVDSVIMKDRNTGHPRGFGFITYADPSVVDKVIADTHVFSGKQVEIKRTIPKGSVQSKDLRTKKIFVGGLPATSTNDDFKNFFSKFGKVMESEIILDHATKRSRGFGFVVFDSEQVVDDLLSKGNMIDFAGTQVEIKKAEPKQASGPPPVPYFSENRGRSFGDGLGGFGDSYNGYGGSRFASSYRTSGSFSSRYGGYGGFGGSAGEFDSGYGGGSFGGYRGESSLGFSSRFGSYGGYGGSYGSGVLGGYSRGGDGYGSYLGSYDSGPSGGYGAGGIFGGRGGYSGGGRYHPYSR